MKCETCSSETDLFTCSACKTVYYCSRDCQRQNWRHHRPSCATTSTAKHACDECRQVQLKGKSGKFSISACHRVPGDILFENIAKRSNIPIAEMKIIVKGVVVSLENYRQILTCESKSKINGMVLGEPSLDSSGLRERDIGYLAEKYKLARNEAIKRLRRSNGDVIGAFVDIENS